MKYTMAFREQFDLADGTRLQLRAIQPSDKAALAEGFAQLSPDSRRKRFHTAKAQLSEAELHFLTECDGQSHFAIVATCDDGSTGEPMGVGVARFVSSADNPAVAELAITVADAWQHRGVGSLLLQRIVAAAAEHGVERLQALLMADNNAMKVLMRKHLKDVTYTEENGTVTLDLPIDATSAIDQTLLALRQLTLDTMIMPLRVGESALSRLMELSGSREDHRTGR